MFSLLIKSILIFISILIIPTILILFSPIYILRVFVSYLSVLHPDLSNLINPRSHVLAVDDIYSNPKCNIFMRTVVKGDLELEYVRKTFQDKVINIKRDDGQLRNVELRQYPYQWMGFMFWRWEENFDLSQHINYYQVPESNENSKLSENQLQEIYSQLVTKPFEKKRSPWEMLIIRNIASDSKEVHSVFLIRWHHCLADGLSMLKITLDSLTPSGTKIEDLVPQPINIFKLNGLRQCVSLLKMIILAPYHLLQGFVIDCDKNEWRISPSKFKNEYITSSQNISLNLLKEIKNVHNVGLTVVILSGLTAALRKAMMKNCGELPEHIRCSLPIPIGGHPDKLTNHLSNVNVKLPVGEKDSLKRLKSIQRNLDELKGSLAPVLLFYALTAIGGLFPGIIRLILKDSVTTVVGTSFPGPKMKLAIDGQEITDVQFYIGATVGTSPAMFTSLTYGEDIRLTVSMNSAILDSQEEVDAVAGAMKEEFKFLRNCLKNC